MDLRAFEEFPADVTIEARAGEISPFGDSVVRVDGITVRLAIQQSAREYYCQGRVNARAALECARCLVEYDAELDGPTDFIVCSDEEKAELGSIDSEEYVCFRGNDLRVDIVERVHQALMLALPMKPLCSEECRGLCPKCGINLNEQACKCETRTTDPRWEGLSDLLPK